MNLRVPREAAATAPPQERPSGAQWTTRAQRLWERFFPTLRTSDPETRDALEARNRETTAGNLSLTAGVVAGLTVVAWPTDYLIYAQGSPELTLLLRWRLMLLATTLGVVLLLRTAAWARRHPYSVALVVYALAMGIPAWLNADLGDIRSPFFYGVYTAPLMTVLLAVRPLPRALAIAVVVGTYLAVFFARRPEALDDPMAGAVFVWLAASAVTAQVAGNALYYLLGVRFLQQRALDRQQSELRELDRLRRDFFANISHELRTPLTNILGALRGLEMGHAPERAADVGLRNAARLRRLVDDLLSLARFDRAAPRPERRLVDLAGLAEAVAEAFRFPGGHVLEIRAEARPMWARLDPQQVRTALTNLLGNATKFSAPADGPVTVRVKRRGGDVEVEVEDHGVGIPPADLPHLFDRFYRGTQPAGEARGGAGIGLSLVYEIVRAHGGETFARSELGYGTTITLRFPSGPPPTADEVVAATAAHGSTDEDSSQPKVRRGFGRRRRGARPTDEPLARPLVLVADDDPDLVEYLSRTLSRRFRTVQARDGREALDRARALRPAVIVSDLRMPRMGGDELLRAVRDTPGIAHTPLLFLTAHAGPRTAPERLAAGADEFLVKPFEEDELLERVDLLVARSTRERELEARVREATRALRRSAAQLVAAQEAERRRLARDLHDQVGPVLVGLHVEVAAVREWDAESAGRMEEMLDELQRCFRATLQALRPSDLDQQGVFSALRALARDLRDRHGLPCEVVFSAEPEELTEAQELAVYRIAQEALTNVVRHARATRARISFEEDARPGWRVLRVVDDGVGWSEPEPGTGRVGLVGMRERTHLLGGELRVGAVEPHGTEVVARFPLALVGHERTTRSEAGDVTCGEEVTVDEETEP